MREEQKRLRLMRGKKKQEVDVGIGKRKNLEKKSKESQDSKEDLLGGEKRAK